MTGQSSSSRHRATPASSSSVRSSLPASPRTTDDPVRTEVDSETGKPAAGRAAGIRRRYADSSADHLWRRLNAIDFVNRGMLAAAVLLLSFIPFVIVAEALAGRSAISTMVRRFGLDPAAARAVGTVFASPRETTSSITGLSWVFLVLSGLASAAAIQELYEHVFEVKNRGFVRETPRRIVWIVAL